MGMFSTQYVFQTATSTQAIVPDAQNVPVWDELPLKARLHKASIHSAFKQELMLGFTAKVEQLVHMAKDPSRYALGMLDHTLIAENSGLGQTQTYLENLHGTAVTFDYHHVAPLNLMHVGYSYLKAEQGYAQVGNQVSAQNPIKGYPVYLEHMQLVLNTRRDRPTQTAAIEEAPEWETAPNRRFLPWENPYANQPSWEYITSGLTKVVFHCAYVAAMPREGTATAIDWEANGVPETAYPPDMDDPDMSQYGYSWKAAYGLTGAPMEDFIVRYTLTFTPEVNGFDNDGTYFSSKYRYSDGGVDHVGYFTHAINAGTIPSIEASLTEVQPSINFMPWVFFRSNFQNLAIPATETTDSTPEYKQRVTLLKKMGIDYQEFSDELEKNPEISNVSQSFLMFGIDVTSQRSQGIKYLFEFFLWLHQFRIRDTSKQQGLVFSDATAKMTLTYNQIEYLRTHGTLNAEAKVGDYSASTRTHQYIETRYVTERDPNHDDGRLTTRVVQVHKTLQVHTYKKQITVDRIETIELWNPRIMYLLSNRDGSDPQDVYTQDGDPIVIPLSHDLARLHFNFTERKELYMESLHLVNNAYERIRLEWYETSTFAFFLQAAALVATFISLGSLGSTAQATYLAILTTVGNQVAALVLTALVFAFARYGLDKMFELVAEEVGSRNANLGALLLLVAAVYSASTGNVHAQTLLDASMGLMNAADTELQNEVGEMNADLEYERELLEKEQDLAEEIYDEFYAGIDMAKRVGLMYVFNHQETPEQFFERSFIGINSNEALVNHAETYLATALTI